MEQLLGHYALVAVGRLYWDIEESYDSQLEATVCLSVSDKSLIKERACQEFSVSKRMNSPVKWRNVFML